MRAASFVTLLLLFDIPPLIYIYIFLFDIPPLRPNTEFLLNKSGLLQEYFALMKLCFCCLFFPTDLCFSSHRLFLILQG